MESLKISSWQITRQTSIYENTLYMRLRNISVENFHFSTRVRSVLAKNFQPPTEKSNYSRALAWANIFRHVYECCRLKISNICCCLKIFMAAFKALEMCVQLRASWLVTLSCYTMHVHVSMVEQKLSSLPHFRLIPNSTFRLLTFICMLKSVTVVMQNTYKMCELRSYYVVEKWHSVF